MLIIIDVDHGNQGGQGFCKGQLNANLSGHFASLSAQFVIMSINFCFFPKTKVRTTRMYVLKKEWI